MKRGWTGMSVNERMCSVSKSKKKKNFGKPIRILK